MPKVPRSAKFSSPKTGKVPNTAPTTTIPAEFWPVIQIQNTGLKLTKNADTALSAGSTEPVKQARMEDRIPAIPDTAKLTRSGPKSTVQSTGSTPRKTTRVQTASKAHSAINPNAQTAGYRGLGVRIPPTDSAKLPESLIRERRHQSQALITLTARSSPRTYPTARHKAADIRTKQRMRSPTRNADTRVATHTAKCTSRLTRCHDRTLTEPRVDASANRANTAPFHFSAQP